MHTHSVLYRYGSQANMPLFLKAQIYTLALFARQENVILLEHPNMSRTKQRVKVLALTYIAVLFCCYTALG